MGLKEIEELPQKKATTFQAEAIAAEFEKNGGYLIVPAKTILDLTVTTQEPSEGYPKFHKCGLITIEEPTELASPGIGIDFSSPRYNIKFGITSPEMREQFQAWDRTVETLVKKEEEALKEKQTQEGGREKLEETAYKTLLKERNINPDDKFAYDHLDEMIKIENMEQMRGAIRSAAQGFMTRPSNRRLLKKRGIKPEFVQNVKFAAHMQGTGVNSINGEVDFTVLPVGVFWKPTQGNRKQ